MSYRLYRSLHRHSHATMTGMRVFAAALGAGALGIGLFALRHVADLTLWGLLLALAVCQCFAEIFVVRNHVLCVIFTTPLALMMGNVLALPLGETVTSRTIEVLLSVVFALLLLWVAPRDAAPVEALAQSLAGNHPDLAAERWDAHLTLQNTGYALLGRCNARPDTRLPVGDIQSLAERIS